MNLERVFNARLQQIVRCDSVSVRHVRFNAAVSKEQRHEWLAHLEDEATRQSIHRLYEDHDGIEIEWDGSFSSTGVHGSLNICSLSSLIERISEGDLQHELAIDPTSDTVGKISLWAEIEREFGSPNAIYFHGPGLNSICLRIGERLAPGFPDARASLEMLTDLLGIDGARAALTGKNWRAMRDALRRRLERLD